ncbi:MAG: 2-oxoglutarate dehydrogenase component, partial [Sphingomonas bacterium]|nr:2-oxoglutarate dehydrogenase component [Sphingomonas bacterium]
MATEVKVPVLGESITEATLGQWLKQPGEAVKADEPIASLETDKVAVDVPSPVDGVMGELAVGEGDTVQVGALIAFIQEGAIPASGATVAPENKTAVAQAESGPAAAPAGGDKQDAKALSPSVRRAVIENQVDPATVRGTGRDGRLTKEDVLAAAKAGDQPEAKAPPAAPKPAAAPNAA